MKPAPQQTTGCRQHPKWSLCLPDLALTLAEFFIAATLAPVFAGVEPIGTIDAFITGTAEWGQAEGRGSGSLERQTVFAGGVLKKTGVNLHSLNQSPPRVAEPFACFLRQWSEGLYSYSKTSLASHTLVYATCVPPPPRVGIPALGRRPHPHPPPPNPSPTSPPRTD